MPPVPKLYSRLLADVAQLARASPCHGEGRGFESHHPLAAIGRPFGALSFARARLGAPGAVRRSWQDRPVADPGPLRQREDLARHVAGEPAVERVLASARSQWLPTCPRDRSAADVAAVPLAGAKFTAGTLLLALREAPLVIVVLSAVFLASETWQFFARLDGWEYAKVIGGLIVIMAVILVIGLREEARAASTVPEEAEPPDEVEQPLVEAGFGAPPAGLRAPRSSRWTFRALQVGRLTLLCVGVGLAAGGPCAPP